MRKLGLAVSSVLVLLAASLVSALAAPASGSAPIPSPPGHHAGARSPHLAAPAIGVRSPASVVSTPVCDGNFDVVASPNGTGQNVLESTSAVSANDVWSVGIQTTSSNLDRTLAEHWNGTTWSVVPTVNPGSGHNDLYGVSAVSSSNVWAVGAYETNHTTQASATIAEHWNGTSWTKVTTANPSTFSYLFAVTAVSSSSVWAVGAYFNVAAGAYKTLVEHFNGSSWAVVSSPNTGASDSWNQLFAVSAWNDTDIWAVGSITPSVGALQSLAEHWNGTSWAVVSTPNLSIGTDTEIIGVNALEAGHAVGIGYGNFVSATTPRRGETWDLLTPGVSTSLFEVGPGAGDNALLAVARSGASVWAVGYWRATLSSARQTLVIPATWDSAAHSLTWAPFGTSASPGPTDNALFAAEAVSPSVVWAAGYSANGSVVHTLTELYCGLHFNLSAPATAGAGVPFALTVTAENPNNSTDTAYRGTVHFTSSDSQAVLPGNYTFTPGDAGVHTFSGVVLKNPYNQPSTITVSDTVTPFIAATASITVSCAGACPSSAGTPGARGTGQAPAGSPGSRLGNQSPVVSPGPRVPRHLLAVYGGSPGDEGNLATASVADRTRVGVQAQPGLTTVPSRTTVPARTTTGLALTQGDDQVLVSQRTIASPRAAELAWNVGLVVPPGLLIIALLALRLPRRKEKSNVNVRP